MTDVKNVAASRSNPLADDSDSDDPANYGGEDDFSTGLYKHHFDKDSVLNLQSRD